MALLGESAPRNILVGSLALGDGVVCFSGAPCAPTEVYRSLQRWRGKVTGARQSRVHMPLPAQPEVGMGAILSMHPGDHPAQGAP